MYNSDLDILAEKIKEKNERIDMMKIYTKCGVDNEKG